MRASLSIDQLHVNANLVASASYATFNDVANAELTADLLNIDWFALIGEVLRAITKLPDIRDRSVVRSSVIPSAKYSCSRSSLRFVKGSTTIDRRGAAAGWEINRIIFVNDS